MLDEYVCSKCGIAGIHACPGKPIPPPTPEEEDRFRKRINEALMVNQYISTKIVTAWPQEREGQEGYGVRYADGYESWSPKQAFEEGNVLIGVIDHYEPHVQRMYAEQARLSSDINKLKAFLAKVDAGLVEIPADQKQLMVLQFDAMSLHNSILKKRIVLSLKKV